MSEHSIGEPTPQTPPKVSVWRRLTTWMRDILETLVPALLIVLVVNAFLAQATRVEGQSMEPNLHDNQRLVIEKISYHFHPPQRGDVVVLKRPNRQDDPPLIKRVVALAGETIEIRDGRVYINGEVLDESYLDQMTFGDVGPLVVSPEHVYVLGDNRGASNDSRSFGQVALSDIIGRAWLRYWPLDEIGVMH